jgi:hypothetical protein
METMSDAYIKKFHRSPDFVSHVTNGEYKYSNLNSASEVTPLDCSKFSHLMNFLHIRHIGKDSVSFFLRLFDISNTLFRAILYVLRRSN